MKMKQACAFLARVSPSFPGLLDDSEGDDRILTAQYTCVRTGGAVGPDNNVASPEACCDSRSCYLETRE